VSLSKTTSFTNLEEVHVGVIYMHKALVVIRSSGGTACMHGSQ
jgi:hypothetical protein